MAVTVPSPHAELGLKPPRLTSRRFWRVGKRAIDVVLSATVLLLAAPLFLAVAAAIKLDSPGPVFYRANRVGYRGRPLPMLKFRKMYDGAGGGPLTAHDDDRLTRVGAVLTGARLDELPQFWDVLRGRMSIIGPRPESPEFVALHVAEYNRVLTVRPGVSGLSQIAFARERQILDAGDPIGHYVDRILPQKVAMDVLYAERSSLRLDFWVVFWTLATVLGRLEVAVHRRTARMNLRRRPLPPRSGDVPVPGRHLEERPHMREAA